MRMPFRFLRMLSCWIFTSADTRKGAITFAGEGYWYYLCERAMVGFNLDEIVLLWLDMRL